MTGAAYAQICRWDWTAFYLSVPVGIVTTAVLLGNNLRDEEEDKTADVRTLTHRVGPRKARMVYALCVVASPLAVICLVALRLSRPGPLLCAISLVSAFVLVRKVFDVNRIPNIDAQTARHATLFFLTLWIGLSFL